MADETHVEFVPVQEDEVDTTDRCSDIYANVVDVGGTLSDMHIQFSLIDRPQCRVHLSFTTAKDLAVSLKNIVDAFEDRTGRSIITMEEVKKGLNKVTPDDSKKI